MHSMYIMLTVINVAIFSQQFQYQILLPITLHLKSLTNLSRSASTPSLVLQLISTYAPSLSLATFPRSGVTFLTSVLLPTMYTGQAAPLSFTSLSQQSTLSTDCLFPRSTNSSKRVASLYISFLIYRKSSLPEKSQKVTCTGAALSDRNLSTDSTPSVGSWWEGQGRPRERATKEDLPVCGSPTRPIFICTISLVEGTESFFGLSSIQILMIISRTEGRVEHSVSMCQQIFLHQSTKRTILGHLGRIELKSDHSGCECNLMCLIFLRKSRQFKARALLEYSLLLLIQVSPVLPCSTPSSTTPQLSNEIFVGWVTASTTAPLLRTQQQREARFGWDR